MRVVMPLYSSIGSEWRRLMTEVAVFEVQLAWRRQYCGVRSLRRGGVVYYFIDNEYYFKRPSLYGHFDDAERYAFFSMAVVEMMNRIGFYPDILHAHDWQGALSIVYLNLKYREIRGYENIKTVYTIHNIEYQGQFDSGILGDVLSLGEEHRAVLDYDGRINLMKAGIDSADIVTTVSPRYAEEIKTCENGRGLEHILRRHAGKLIGILNGIDYSYYNPETDEALEKNYSHMNVEDKYPNKISLQKKLALPKKDVPMLAVISRLASHKGLDLITAIADGLIAENDIQFVLLGQGEKRFETYFLELEEKYPDKVRTLIDYNRELSRRIYAAADIFLMPSLTEPCGLSQMIASRYGAIPVVRETGGLFDSIKGFWEAEGELRGNGFTFANYSPAELRERIGAALSLWHDREKRLAFVRKIMSVDFSWSASAEKYMEIYNRIS
jgi:starch synthase